VRRGMLCHHSSKPGIVGRRWHARRNEQSSGGERAL
jgi:hypothetical protein